MQSHKKTTDYIKVQDVTDADPGRFANSIKKVTKKPDAKKMKDEVFPQEYKNIWYLKTLPDNEKALREVIAQEIFRLLIPNQPKTRLIEGAKAHKKYIASKEVPGYRALDSVRACFVKSSIKNGTYHGLGEVLIASLYVNESDLRPVNMCLDENNQIIKIDGDRCFLRMFPDLDYVKAKKRKYDITEKDLVKLPYVEEYTPWNWLDLIEQGVRNPAPKLIDDNISQLPAFRAEINRAILKVLILPEQVLKKVIQSASPNVWLMRQFSDEMISRQEQLKVAALNNPDFCHYMLTSQPAKDLKQYLQYLNEFKTTGKHDLEMKLYLSQIHEKKNKLVSEANIFSVSQNGGAMSYGGRFFANAPDDPMDLDGEVEKGAQRKYKWG